MIDLLDPGEEAHLELTLAQRVLEKHVGQLICIRHGFDLNLAVCRLLDVDREWLMVEWVTVDGTRISQECIRFDNVTSILFDGVELDRMKLATALRKEDEDNDNEDP